MEKPRIVMVIQARMGSTRLPEKVLKKVMDRPLLDYQVERLRKVSFVDEIVVATTTNAEDHALVDFCVSKRIPFFLGSSEDVLDRFFQAAQRFHADVIVRITADCPLIDPRCVEQVIQLYLTHVPQYDYVSNALQRSFPIGMDAEVFSFKSLEEAAAEAITSEEGEHVTPFIYRRPERFSCGIVTHDPNLSHLRLTVDTQEDFTLVSKILEDLYPKNPDFSLDDIITLLKTNPDWLKINAHVPHKHL